MALGLPRESQSSSSGTPLLLLLLFHYELPSMLVSTVVGARASSVVLTNLSLRQVLSPKVLVFTNIPGLPQDGMNLALFPALCPGIELFFKNFSIPCP